MGEVIRKTKNGKFVGWYIRWRDENGRRKCKASKQPTAAEARKMLVQIEAQVARGGAVGPEPTRLTIAELAERFLDSGHLRAKDPAKYREKADKGFRMILPSIGHMRIDKLHRRDLEAVRDRLLRKYAHNTVRFAFRPLGAALSWAIKQDLLAQSPMFKLDMPRRTASTDRLTSEEAARLIEAAREQAEAASRSRIMWGSIDMAVRLALRLGLRRGEIFGLRWQDVDLARKRLTVARSYKGTTKNGKVRTLPISAPLAEELAAWRPKCPVSPGGLVCPSGDGARQGIYKLLRDAGCPISIRPWHTLRHTFASLFVEGGGSVMVLKEILGHASLDMTLVYSHIAPAALAADIEKVRI